MATVDIKGLTTNNRLYLVGYRQHLWLFF